MAATFAQLMASIDSVKLETLQLLLPELDKIIDARNKEDARKKTTAADKAKYRTALNAHETLPSAEEDKLTALYAQAQLEINKPTPETTSLIKLIRKFRSLHSKYDITAQAEQLRSKVQMSDLGIADPDMFDEIMLDIDQLTENVNLNRLRKLSGLG